MIALQMPPKSYDKKQLKCLGRTFVCSPIHAFLCAVHVTLSRIELISYHFGDSKTLQHTAILRCIAINLSQSL